METKQIALTLSFAEVVVEHMDDSKTTVLSLAEKTGIPRSTLRRSLHGNRQITLNEVAAIANALHTPIAELIAEAEKRLEPTATKKAA